MSKRIYVGNLPSTATDTRLMELFSPHGNVGDIKVITDRGTGISKGFAFVEMPNDDEAEKAIAALAGSVVGGNALIVNEARPRSDR